MKLPADIKSNHKLRDAKICLLWSRDNMTMKDIGSRFGITLSRVQQIISNNKHLIKIDKEYEKLKRLATLKRMLEKHPEEIGKKDTLDILDQMRIETEGNKVEHSGQTQEKIVIILHPDYKRSEDRDTSSVIPKQIFR